MIQSPFRNSLYRGSLFLPSLFTFVLSTCFIFSVGHADGWESLGNIDGVNVSRKTIKNSNLFAFKGERKANIPLDQLMSVFSDPKERKNWVDRYKDHITFKKTPLSETYWIRFGLPPLISDRDYILKTDAKIDEEAGRISVHIKSTTHPKDPKNCCVRAEVKRTYYQFTALSATETHMMVEVHTDPKGLLPNWIVNLIQKKWPSKTLNGLLNRALKVNKSHPKVKTILDQKFPPSSP